MKLRTDIYTATFCQLAVALLLLWITRFLFVAYNYDSASVAGRGEALRLSLHGLRFDITAVMYFNALFLLLRVLPFRFTLRPACLKATDWIYWITNSLLLAINLGDTPYYRFTGSRLRFNSLKDIASDPNMGGVILSYFPEYWAVYLGTALFIAALVWLYKRFDIRPCRLLTRQRSAVREYSLRTALFLLCGGLAVVGMRGRTGNGVPLSIGDAGWHIRTAPQVNVVLNSPFCILRSIGKDNDIEPLRFFSDEELPSIRTSLHRGRPGGPNGKNVVIITIESGGSVWYDALCPIPNDDLRGLVPFLDSIASRSLVCRNTIATGRRSVEGITAIYGGFPTFVPFVYVLSPYNGNLLDAPARLLGREGYSSVFYFGCNHGSFHIDQIARAAGFGRIVDREAYGDDSEFDGHWGIFDHAMAEYAAQDLSKVPEPFIAGWFTLNAHSPYTKPEHWQPDGYRHPEASPQRGIEYTDRAVRRFFETTRRQPWYDNTIFIITADHGSRDLKETPYDTPYVKYHVPLIIYTPDGSVAPGYIDDRMATQCDIAPTVLGLLDYPHDYVAVGTDLFDTQTERYGIGFIDNMYRITGTKYLINLSADGRELLSVFDIAADPYMTAPTDSYDRNAVASMIRWGRAFLQDYTFRMVQNRMAAAHCPGE